MLWSFLGGIVDTLSSQGGETVGRGARLGAMGHKETEMGCLTGWGCLGVYWVGLCLMIRSLVVGTAT